jgi:hypothetical protein
MTVPAGTRRMPPYAGNGTTTDFAFTFYVPTSDALSVIVVNDITEVQSVKVFDTDYTIEGLGVEGGGTVVFTVAPETGYSVYLLGDTPVTQPADFKNQSSYQGIKVERGFDRAAIQTQELENKALVATDLVTLNYDAQGRDIEDIGAAYVDELYINGVLVVPEGMAYSLPDPTGNGLEILRVNSGGTAYETKTIAEMDIATKTNIATGNTAAVFKVATVAAMKALTGLADGAVVQPLGYYTAGDLPLTRRTFHVDASPPADNGFNVIHDDAGVGYFSIPISTYVYAWDAGVIADWNGSTGTDNEPLIANIQAAITEGVIVFQQGDYKLLDELVETRNNIHFYGLSTATFVVPSTTTTTTGVVINFYDNVSTQPVNARLTNINVDISTNSGGNVGGIRWGGSYGGCNNVNIRIRGDNMTGLILQTDDAGSGPYYNDFERIYVQGDSTSGTPLTGTKGFDLRSSTVTPSRSPNTNSFTKCRAGSVYDGYTIRGAGNGFFGCVSEAINNDHYVCGHASVASGSTRNTIVGPYCESQSTSTVFRNTTNASGNLMINPYYTGVSALFVDTSTNLNNRLIDSDELAAVGAPVVFASGSATGTTLDFGFGVSSITTDGTGLFRVNFSVARANTNYLPFATPNATDCFARISTLNTAYVRFAFLDAAGALVNPTGFRFEVKQ